MVNKYKTEQDKLSTLLRDYAGFIRIENSKRESLGIEPMTKQEMDNLWDKMWESDENAIVRPGVKRIVLIDLNTKVVSIVSEAGYYYKDISLTPEIKIQNVSKPTPVPRKEVLTKAAGDIYREEIKKVFEEAGIEEPQGTGAAIDAPTERELVETIFDRLGWASQSLVQLEKTKPWMQEARTSEEEKYKKVFTLNAQTYEMLKFRITGEYMTMDEKDKLWELVKWDAYDLLKVDC